MHCPPNNTAIHICTIVKLPVLKNTEFSSWDRPAQQDNLKDVEMFMDLTYFGTVFQQVDYNIQQIPMPCLFKLTHCEDEHEDSGLDRWLRDWNVWRYWTPRLVQKFLTSSCEWFALKAALNHCLWEDEQFWQEHRSSKLNGASVVVRDVCHNSRSWDPLQFLQVHWRQSAQ